MSLAMHPCPSCARHVRRDEASCPFCASALPVFVESARLAPATFRGISRAALLVAGALGAVACGGGSTYDANTMSGYGGPPQADPSSGNDPRPSSAGDAGGATPADPADGTPRYK